MKNERIREKSDNRTRRLKLVMGERELDLIMF